jgi:predicted nucleic acid-binding Zn ribbon protein
MNFESVQNKSREAIAEPQQALVRSFQPETSTRTCLVCGTFVQLDESRCNVCGHELSREVTASVSLKDTLLFFAVLLLVALNIAPVWSSDQIYGKAIFFIQKLGIILPKSASEAEQYRSMISNVINVYHTLNLVYYITIALVAFLFIFDWMRGKQGFVGFPKVVWLILGLALLLFPFANLVVSWNMFFSPGVIGTSIAAFIILFAGIISRKN